MSDNPYLPQKGHLYEAVDEVAVDYVVEWAAPISTGGSGMLLPGDQVIIKTMQDFPPTRAAEALNYSEIEQRMISERNAAKYERFYLIITSADLKKKFKLIGEWRRPD